jgi:hypothetical protein
VVKIAGAPRVAPSPERTRGRVGHALGPLLLVHGGGAEASAWCARLGLEARCVDGLRVTDEPTLEVVTAVLAGLANKRLVAALRAADIDAVGLSALDGDVIEAVRHPDAARLGQVGAVGAVHPALLHQLMSHGRLPVVASIGALDGALLNLNADDVAGALAGGVRAETLVLLSDAPGGSWPGGSRSSRSRLAGAGAREPGGSGRHAREAPRGARGARRGLTARDDRRVERAGNALRPDRGPRLVHFDHRWLTPRRISWLTRSLRPQPPPRRSPPPSWS